MGERVLFASIGLASGVLALGYLLADLPAGTLLVLVLGIVWLCGQWRDWSWVSSAGLFSCTAAAAVGLFVGLRAEWMIIGQVAALAAWDMGGLRNRLRTAAGADHRRALEKRHFQWLVPVAVLGLLLAVVALYARLDLSFGTIMLLALAGIAGLSQMIAFLRRASH